jgi:type IV pilus assembly protein PilO
MRNRSWFNYAVIALVLVGLFFFVYYKPRMSQLSDMKKQRISAEDQVAKLRIKKKQMDKIERDLASMSLTLKDLEEIIPKQREISEILTRFQQLAYDTSLNITKFNQRPESFKDYYSEWPLLLEITGTYHNLGNFFDRLSRFPRLFTIERFTIKSLARQTETSTLSATFTAKTYLFLDEEQIKALQAKTKAKRGGTTIKSQPPPTNKRGQAGSA